MFAKNSKAYSVYLLFRFVCPLAVSMSTVLDRLRPWLYLAAVFVGLGFFFEAVMKTTQSSEAGLPDSLLVRTEVAKDSFDIVDEDEDYYDFLEDQYAEILLAEEMSLYSE